MRRRSSATSFTTRSPPHRSRAYPEEFLVVAFDGVRYDLHRDLALLPSYDLHAPSLQILVDVEEVLHLLEVMLREIRNVESVVVKGVMRRHGDDLVVRLSAVQELENAKRTAVYLAAGKRRLVDADENVEGVAVLMEGSRDEPIITRIMNCGKENAVQPELAGDLVELVLVAAAAWNLDHRSDAFRRVRANKEIVPGIHGLKIERQRDVERPHPSSRSDAFARSALRSSARRLPAPRSRSSAASASPDSSGNEGSTRREPRTMVRPLESLTKPCRVMSA